MCIHGETDGQRRIEWLWFIFINNFFSSVYGVVFSVIQIHSWNKNFDSLGEKKIILPSETWHKYYRNVVFSAKFWRKKWHFVLWIFNERKISHNNVPFTVWVNLLWFIFGLQECFFLATLCIFPTGISLLYFFLLISSGFKFCILMLPVSDKGFSVNIS